MKFQAVDISKTATAAQVIFASLRRAILDGDLQDGEPLRQDEIAKAFHTSRFPVREALTLLEQQGLVKTQRYKGAVVATLSMQEASEIFDFRAKLEADVIRAAVPKLSPETLNEARGFLERFACARNPMDYGVLNRQFHASPYSVSGLPYHLSVIESSIDRIDRYIRAQLVMSGIARSNDEHLKILEACEAGDADLAARLTYDHIHDAKDALQAQLKRNS
ncbi:GntR family transcriptional regulator [Pseudophaeobacter leonis]|uniref:GntR family transcriptional regulator n=1 Tax=Pseudophaeobacter leonis TaxID=1144477 RepID=UPI0009F5A035|nr:GntR family transcriptional regulator [Pseudophaeobacter leonis]